MENYWEKWKDSLPEDVRQDTKVQELERYLKAAGALCATCAVLCMLSMWCASRIMEHEYTLQKSTQVREGAGERGGGGEGGDMAGEAGGIPLVHPGPPAPAPGTAAPRQATPAPFSPPPACPTCPWPL